MTSHENYELFLEALDVVNEALDENRGEGVYGKIIDLFDEHVDGHEAAVGVYEEDPDAPFDYFTIRFTEGHFELAERGKGQHETDWQVSRDYLRDLTEDPETYIENPARIDLRWLADRLPDEAASLLERVS